MHTDTTAIFLQEIGWPPALTKQLQTVWATTRWIEFDNHVHPEPIVSRAVPQGCPLAPLALACWMCSGLQAVNNTLVAQGHSPNATRKAFCQCYMDDRTFVDADLNRGLDRAHAWWQWSPTVGLKENQDKTQFCAKSNKNRELLRQQHPEWVTTTVTALGVSIRAKPTKNTALEEERLEKTFSRANLIGCLPLSFAYKLALFRCFAASLATYGWSCRIPPQATTSKVFSCLSKTLKGNTIASPLIRSAIYGGNCHMDILVACRLLRRLCRLKAKNNLLWTCKQQTAVGAFRQWLRGQGWLETGPWKWLDCQNNVLCVSHTTDIEEACHKLRQQWRANMLYKWSKGARHEVQQWQHLDTAAQMRVQIENLDLDWVRQNLMTVDGAGRAVLLGSMVSPALRARQEPRAQLCDKCPWCDQLGTWQHVCWSCKRIPIAAQRPPKPKSFLAQRFAWPQMDFSRQERLRILRWLTDVQRLLWQLRHGS